VIKCAERLAIFQKKNFFNKVWVEFQKPHWLSFHNSQRQGSVASHNNPIIIPSLVFQPVWHFENSILVISQSPIISLSLLINNMYRAGDCKAGATSSTQVQASTSKLAVLQRVMKSSSPKGSAEKLFHAKAPQSNHVQAVNAYLAVEAGQGWHIEVLPVELLFEVPPTNQTIPTHDLSMQLYFLYIIAREMNTPPPQVNSHSSVLLCSFLSLNWPVMNDILSCH